jgi:sialate O-acetylesterase
MKNQTKYRNSIFFIILIFASASINLFGQDLNKIINLKGNWKFSIGDNTDWADPNYNDSDWDEIYVPSSWEDHGFHGYNGYAWYRLKFKLPEKFRSKTSFLILGFIDDVDEVYLNGELIGFTGSFPPDYETAYNAYRKYSIPFDQLNLAGENYIAVRVYDSQLAGGILNGDIGIFAPSEFFDLQLDLSGRWKFNIGDEFARKEPNFNDSDWKEIIVPALWETQGFKNYDGAAWYRKHFELPEDLENQKLVLMLGKIDDIDECYLNGKLIGSTGIFAKDPSKSRFGSEWSQIRGYYIPANLLKSGENIIAVRVYDGFRDGGIYEGPIGIIKQDDYVSYWKQKKRKRSIWEILFDN